jgi:CcmD family protein
MEYLAIAYALIAIALVGYTLSLRTRRNAIERERARLESKSE